MSLRFLNNIFSNLIEPIVLNIYHLLHVINIKKLARDPQLINTLNQRFEMNLRPKIGPIDFNLIYYIFDYMYTSNFLSAID